MLAQIRLAEQLLNRLMIQGGSVDSKCEDLRREINRARKSHGAARDVFDKMNRLVEATRVDMTTTLAASNVTLAERERAIAEVATSEDKARAEAEKVEREMTALMNEVLTAHDRAGE